MKRSTSPAMRDKVKQLRRSYIGKLPQMLTDARQDCVRLSLAPVDEQVVYNLLRCFHNIKGTAGSLSLPEISAAAGAASDLIHHYRQVDPAAWRAALEWTLEELYGAIDRLEALSTEEPADDEMSDPNPAMDGAKEVKRPAEPRRRVVFYCDKDLDVAGLGAQLSCFGYQHTCFDDADALKAAVMADPPDAVVMSTNTVDVMKDIRASVDIPALFIAQQGDFGARLKAIQAGGEAYFVKPVSAHDVIDVLDAVTVRSEPDPFRILIVDDEAETATYHGLILEAAGMMVRRLEKPEDILDELTLFQPDLVLMDLYMPGCSGRDLALLVRQITEFVSLPIIFLSSETNKAKQISAMRVGADGFMTKPVAPDDLVTAVAVRSERARVLRALMIRDSLTGLLNHTALFQFLDLSLANARRHDGKLCFAMLDLDHFKKINDTYGHPAGDQVLLALARMLKQRLRTSDFIGRYGGEEFGIVMHDVSVAEAVVILDRIRADFAALTFNVDDAQFSSSLSGGIAGFPEIRPADALVEAADRALYAAKHAGRNRIAAADAPSAQTDRAQTHGHMSQGQRRP